MNALFDFLKKIQNAGVDMLARGALNISGDGVIVTDDQPNNRINVVIPGASGAQFFAPTGLTGATAISRYVGATVSGAPTSGTFAVGDFVVDRTNGGLWSCVSAGSPGTWVYVPGLPGLNKVTTAAQTLKASPSGTINELSGSGTGAVLPAATSSNVGSLAVVKFNNLASYAIGRTGTDTIDGGTSFIPSSGATNYQTASFYVSASGVWLSL